MKLYSPINDDDDDDEGFQKNDVEKSWFGDTIDDCVCLHSPVCLKLNKI